MDAASVIYNVPPPEGYRNGVVVDADSPGISPFTFHAQHGFDKFSGPLDNVTGFAACTKSVPVCIHDGRTASEPPSLAEHGFELVSDATDETTCLAGAVEHAHLRDEHHMTDSYYEEACNLARRLLPSATAAYAFNHVHRQSRVQQPSANQPRHGTSRSVPSYMCHADSTATSILANVKTHIASGDYAAIGPSHLSRADQAAVLAAADRVVVLNIWRLVANFGQPSPSHLGLCDQRSVTLKRDSLEYGFFVDGCVAYNYGLNAAQAPNHRWYHFPRLAAHEAIALKLTTLDTQAGATFPPGSSIAPSMTRIAPRRHPSASRWRSVWRSRLGARAPTGSERDVLPRPSLPPPQA
jgi:hypothetical protein